MTISTVFNEFCSSIKMIENEKWLNRLRSITRKINGKYYNNDEDNSSHRLLVGSVGRNTATKGVSDYDVLFVLPKDTYKRFNSYSSHGQEALLQEVISCIKERYSKTDVSASGQVVDVNFDDGLIEVVPGFEKEDGSFIFPDANKGGKWKRTDPRPEKQCCVDDDSSSNGTFRDIARIIRIWKDNIGVVFKGLLIDTFVHDFYKENSELVSNSSYKNYPVVMKNLFEELKNKDSSQSYWYALGSHQQIDNSGHTEFIDSAREAFNKLDNIDLSSENDVINVFSDLLGHRFTKLNVVSAEAKNEQFASEYFNNINIQGTCKIQCIVEQKGFRPRPLDFFISNYRFVFRSRHLRFKIIDLNLPAKYSQASLSFYWKVRNFGDDANNAGQLRGEIFKDARVHEENTLYRSLNHYVECYVVVHNTVIARDKIMVPIGIKNEG